MIEKILIGILVLTMAFALALIADLTIATQARDISGVVAGLEYTPSSVSTGIGVANGNSGSSPVVITSVKPENWTVVVSIDGEYKSISVEPALYYSLSIGQKATFNCKVGIIFGSISSCR